MLSRNNRLDILMLQGFLFFSLYLNAQSLQYIYPEFIQNGKVLKEGTFGGLSAPQFSEVDINNDGIRDLYIYDKIGKLSLTYINGGTPNVVDYSYVPEYQSNFPSFSAWVILKDYNGDGVEDVFAYSSIPGIPGIEVYKGYYNDENQISFIQNELSGGQFNILYYPGSSGNNNLYVSSVDYPAIDDIDGDGDLDILTFNIAGGIVEYYQNQSVERGFGRDSLLYVLADRCWGNFFESGISKEVDLSNNPEECALNFQSIEARSNIHAGSTLLTIDMDNDGDKEVILGDISFSNLNLLINGGSPEDAFMVDQFINFPANSLPVDLPLFPAAFFLDVNNDGHKDLVTSPNLGNDIGETYNVVWYYENRETNENPSFEYIQKDLFVEDMLDFGTGANPVFVDWNQDGLMDLVISNKSFFVPGGMRNARVYLFQNVGTPNIPKYELKDDNLWKLNQYSQNAWRFIPAFGDLDGDGDLDALIGEEFGKLFYAENIAGPGNPMEFVAPEYAYHLIDVGQISRPQIIDLNQDGLLDLVLGERNGNINYFENTGTVNTPVFSPEPTNNFLGKVDTRGMSQVTGYSAPIFLEIDGNIQLFAGNEEGKILRYTDIEDNLDGTFTLLDDDYGAIRTGREVHPAFYDIDNDGFLEMVIGNIRGGICFFKTDLKSEITGAITISSNLQLQLYPNPSANLLVVDVNNAFTPKKIKIYNLAGQLMDDRRYAREIDLRNLAQGIYVLEVVTQRGVLRKKFLKY